MKIRWTIYATAVSLCFLQACASMTPLEDADKSQFKRQIADMNRKIDEMGHRLSMIQFMVDDHQKSIRELAAAVEGTEKKSTNPSTSAQPKKPHPMPTEKAIPLAVSTPSAKQPPVLSESAEMRYNQAIAIYKAKNYKKAASLFNAVAENYPGHDLADNALYWAGECLYSQKDYKGAIRAFKKVYTEYPKGSKVPDALLKTGYAYLALNDPVNAKSFLTKLVKQYPFTPAGTKAGEMLQKIQ